MIVCNRTPVYRTLPQTVGMSNAGEYQYLHRVTAYLISTVTAQSGKYYNCVKILT